MSMKYSSRFAPVLGAVFIILLSPMLRGMVRADDRKHLLVVTVTKGFRHKDSIPIAEASISQWGARSGAYDVTYVRTDEEMQTRMTAGALRHYDGVVFASTTGTLPLPDREAFLTWIREGHAFIGVHAAADTFHDWPAYREMLGAEFKTHGAQVTIQALYADADHAATRNWGGWRLIHDEIYQFKNYDPALAHPLLYMDKHPNTHAPGLYPIAWCKAYGKGRVFYTSLGHRPDVWANPVYQTHLQQGILWSLGLVGGSDALPSPGEAAFYRAQLPATESLPTHAR